MGHICPNCFEAAPLLFRWCPECDFDMKDCEARVCNHCWTTRNTMIRNAAKNKSHPNRKHAREMVDHVCPKCLKKSILSGRWCTKCGFDMINCFDKNWKRKCNHYLKNRNAMKNDKNV